MTISWRWALYSLAIVAGLIATFWRVTATFSVSEVGERAIYVTDRIAASRWYFDSAFIARDYGSPSIFSGSVEPVDSVKITVTRIATGPLFIRMEALNSRMSVGRAFTEADDTVEQLGRVFEIEIPNVKARADAGETVVLPLFGKVLLDRPVAFETSGTVALVKSGRVTMLARSVFFRTPFEAGKYELNYGDAVEVREPRTPSVGFISISEAPGMAIAYRSEGKYATIIKPGGSAFSLFVTAPARISADTNLQYFWLTILAIAGLAKLLPSRKESNIDLASAVLLLLLFQNLLTKSETKEDSDAL